MLLSRCWTAVSEVTLPDCLEWIWMNIPDGLYAKFELGWFEEDARFINTTPESHRSGHVFHNHMTSAGHRFLHLHQNTRLMSEDIVSCIRAINDLQAQVRHQESVKNANAWKQDGVIHVNSSLHLVLTECILHLNRKQWSSMWFALSVLTFNMYERSPWDFPVSTHYNQPPLRSFQTNHLSLMLLLFLLSCLFPSVSLICLFIHLFVQMIPPLTWNASASLLRSSGSFILSFFPQIYFIEVSELFVHEVHTINSPAK